MKGFIHDIWWMFLLRAIALLLFGIAAVVWPGLTFVILAFLYAVYILTSGILNILASIGQVQYKRAWFVILVLGIIEVAVGVYLLKVPGLAVATFVTTVGLLFMVQGILTIIASFIDTNDSGTRLLEIATGILGIIAGVVVLKYPVSGGIAFAWVLGVYGLIAGTLGIAAALSLRNTFEDLEKAIAPQRKSARG